MADPTVDTSDTLTTFTGASGSSKSLTLVAGRAYVALITQEPGTTRTWSITDDLGGNTWTQVNQSSAGRQAVVFVCICATGGAATVTLAIGGGTTTGNWFLLPVIPDGSDTLSVDDSDNFVDSGNTTSHTMANASGFSPAANSVEVGCGGWNGSALGACTPGAGYTELADNGSSFFAQYRINSTAQTDATAPWTSTSSRLAKNAIVSVKATSSGGTSINVTDTGAGSDATPSIGCSFTATDTGSASDSTSCSASVPVADSGSGSDSLTCAVDVTVTDSGSGVESIDIAVLVGLIEDSGAGSDVIAQITQGIFVALTDSGTAVDSVSAVEVVLSIPDTSAGVDSLAAMNAAVGAIADSCSGVDSVSVSTSGGGTRVATITFSARAKSAAFSPVAKSTGFAPNL